MNPQLIKNYVANAAIPAYRIARVLAGGLAELANSATAVSVGVTTDIAAAQGERVDVIHSGVALVECGGGIGVGNPVTANGTGQGVVANPAAGANVRVVGFALETAVASGDVIPVLLSPHTMQG